MKLRLHNMAMKSRRAMTMAAARVERRPGLMAASRHHASPPRFR
jgi:hypothetical protein